MNRTWVNRSGVAVLLAFVAALSASTTPARAQTPPAAPAPKPASNAYRFRLLGIYDEQTGDPIEGVEVSDVLNGNKALTTSTGTVSLMFLPEGGSLVRLRKLGYAVQTLTIAISPSDTTPLTITLVRATELPTVVVKDSAPVRLSPHMRAFEEHKKLGFGQFITEAEMRKADNRSMANFLTSKMTGMMAVAGRTSSTFIVSSRKQCQGGALSGGCRIPNCYVRIYTDNVLTYDTTMRGAPPPDFARINVSDYAAAEFYPGGTALPDGIAPTNADCGTLLLYTREK